MDDRKGLIAKISLPRLPDVFDRRRLTRLIAENSVRPATWVCGPPGSGKTTLVASYFLQRTDRCVWYQIDQRDEDPATFFYYLAQAFKHASPRKRKPIPPLTQAQFISLNAFSFTFFETAFGRLNPSATLVIDNYQLIPPDSVLHQLICNGLGIIPPGIRVIFISREDPPMVYSRIRANSLMALVEWAQLKLTVEETAGIAQLRTGLKLPEDAVVNLHKYAEGWVAGVVLMLDQVEREYSGQFNLLSSSSRVVADYFNAEIFAREPSNVQDFLLKAALLPHLTAQTAAVLTGHAHTEALLDELNRKHRFTEKRAFETSVYQLHPIFRKFLLQRASNTFEKAQWDELRHRAALLLEQNGEIEEAAALCSSLEQWDVLTRIIKGQALALYTQGRYQTLLGWLRSLPEEMVRVDPWLAYWMGVATLPFDPAASRGILERAFEGFRACNDPTGMYLAWSDIVGSIYYSMTDYSALDDWIDVLSQLQADHPRFPSSMIEGRVVAAMFIALNSRQLDHPEIEAWAGRVLALLNRRLDINLNLFLLNHVILHRLYTGDLEKASEVIALMEAAVQSSHSLPIVALISALVKSNYYLLLGMHDACTGAVAKGLEAFRRAGVQFLDLLIEGYGAWSCLTHGDYRTVRRFLEIKAEACRRAPPFDRRLYLILGALEALGRGDLHQAAKYARAVLLICQGIGAQFHLMMAHLINGLVEHENGLYGEADRYTADVLEKAKATKVRQIEFYALLLQARFSLDRGQRRQGLARLRKALALGRGIGIYNPVLETHANVARLFVTALEEGIEVTYARECIRRLHLMPATPPWRLEGWPWPVGIYVLGDFSLVIDGRENLCSGRTNTKPLELLQALIALGGREVPEAQLSDYLWPDADGDLAHTSFNTNLHRLRRLLGDDRALQFKAGRLSLERRCCWVDSWAFEHFVRLSRAAMRRRDIGRAAHWTQKALALYKGPFLKCRPDAVWAVSCRERLKGLFLATIQQAADLHARQGEHDQVAALYRRGLEIDDLVEPFYQGLMRCLKQLDRRPEAALVYQRCRRTLSDLLGIAPSKLTEAIFKSL
jgi:LuxR family transcriptional regulator, maltose regulon positive regulatory protein